MSVYNPNMDFFSQQLSSLNDQTYKNIELIIWDDCPEHPIDTSVVEKCITNFSFKLLSENKNLGVTKAFEKLTDLANGEYIAYCDQDDVWEPNKIEICLETIQKDNSLIVTSDRSIIDAENRVLYESERRSNPPKGRTWNTGDDITRQAMFFCYAPGMTIFVRSDIAKKCIPFPLECFHDRWLILCASVYGKASFIDKPLVRYRRHGKNSSGLFIDIHSKADYYDIRVRSACQLTSVFLERFNDYKHNDQIAAFAKARQEKDILSIFKFRDLSTRSAYFEIALKFIPDFLFKWALSILKKR